MMSNKSQNIREKFKALLSSKTEEEMIERESYILMANYLSEIERLYKNDGLNRKELAAKIHTSPSYLTQVFRGSKPLNFLTLAKFKRALNLTFDVKVSIKSEETENPNQIDLLPAIKSPKNTFFTETFTTENFDDTYNNELVSK